MDESDSSAPVAIDMDDHQKAVSKICTDIFSFHQRKEAFRVYHGSTNSTKPHKIDTSRMIDTSGLNHVLNVDVASKTCLVEPNVPMDQLVDATLEHGLLPLTVMEFPGITVGGGFSGTAGESSGFKEGFFESSVNWIEMVLPNGEKVTASAHEREDLFYGAAGTFGTLGIITLLELRLRESKHYIELTYHPTTDVEDALSVMKRETEDSSNDYVDGILFSAARGVIVTGKLTDELATGTKVQRFSRAKDPWFYIHADRTTKRSLKPVKEATLVRDYLFRYDRGAFWTGRYAFKYFLTPFNRITRWALDYFMHTRVMYHALHASGHSNKYMIQDLLLPSDTAGEFVDYVEEHFNLWPLWLCPFKTDREISLHPCLSVQDGDGEDATTKTFVNVGVWGPGSTKYPTFVAQNRKLEGKVRELGGIKWLYAQAYYTEKEFDEIYDREWYDGLREKYHATYLPSVYEKVGVKAPIDPAERSWYQWLSGQVWDTWPVSGIYGVLKTLGHRDYLLAQKK